MRLAVFDCDGTLVDSQHAIIAAMTAAWQAHGLDAPEAQAVRRVVGLPLLDIIEKLLPGGGPDDFRRLASHYREAFNTLRQHPDHEEPLFPGTREVLDILDGANYLLAIATGKSRRGLRATLELHGLTDRFMTLKTSDDGPGKPNPDMLISAMAEAGAAPSETVMIGDTSFDMLMAGNAGTMAVGVTWGYHDRQELSEAGAARLIEHFAELPEALDVLYAEHSCP
ncbi:MAG: HAD-IA family hydrolase [Alphaproteobacteria bacterium]